MELPAIPPGSCGGHCIGVDPYHLSHKSEALGYHPQLTLAGRRINDDMGAYVAGQMVKAMLRRRIQIDGAKVLVLGLTFKDNRPDLRNTRVIDVVAELQDDGIVVDVHDPWVDKADARREYGIDLVEAPEAGSYDGIVLAVPHAVFAQESGATLRRLGKSGAVLYDLKSVLPTADSDLRL